MQNNFVIVEMDFKFSKKKYLHFRDLGGPMT